METQNNSKQFRSVRLPTKFTKSLISAIQCSCCGAAAETLLCFLKKNPRIRATTKPPNTRLLTRVVGKSRGSLSIVLLAVIKLVATFMLLLHRVAPHRGVSRFGGRKFGAMDKKGVSGWSHSAAFGYARFGIIRDAQWWSDESGRQRHYLIWFASRRLTGMESVVLFRNLLEGMEGC